MKYSILFLTVITLLIFSSYLKAQPYIFSSGRDTLLDTLSGEISYNIYKINLANGQKESVGDGGPSIFWDNTQSWMINGYDHYAIMGLNNNKLLMPSVDPYFDLVVSSASYNKLYLIGTNTDIEDEAKCKDAFAVINATNGEIELNLSIHAIIYPAYHQLFFSSDINKLYFIFYDTVFIPVRADRIKIATLSLSSNRIIKTQNLQDLGYPGASSYSVVDGKQGKAIITSGYHGSFLRRYNIYDFNNNSSSPFLTYEGVTDPFFTNDGSYLILAERYFNSGEIEDYNGKFYVIDVSQQKLIKTLQLHPFGKVYTFDNFPNNIYYYNDSTETAITLNIDSLVTNSPTANELVPAITFPSTQSFTLVVKGSKFTNNSRVIWNGSERTTTLISDSVLNAQINAADVSARGSSLVTIKTGYDISDTLTFAVIDSIAMPIHPILECVHNNGNGTYTAHYGYQNDRDKSVLVPVGGQNSIYPGQSDRGQPYLFYPGRQTDVFTVDFDGSDLTWYLNGRTVTVNASSTPCQ